MDNTTNQHGQQTMSLSRALRYKKRVIETIRSLETDICNYNSVPDESSREIAVKEALERRKMLSQHLIEVKMAITEATKPVHRLVLELAEAKSWISFLQKMDTTHGLKKDPYGGDGLKYSAVVRKSERDNMVRSLQVQIDQLQTKIDQHNSMNVITVSSIDLA